MNNSDKVYQQLLQQSMNVIARQIQSLEQKNRGLRALTDKTTVEIEGLKLQYSELKKAYKEQQERIQVSERKEAKLDKLDEKSNNISEQQQEHIDKISELKQVQSNMKTARAKRKVAKEIIKQQEIIQKLQKQQARIDLRQKAVMLPKFYRMKKRAKLLNRQQAKVNQAAFNMQDNQALKEMLEPENKVRDRVRSAIYDIKGAYYQRKFEHSQAVLETMKDSKSNIVIRGANAITMSKKAANVLRTAAKKGMDAVHSLMEENSNTTVKQPMSTR